MVRGTRCIYISVVSIVLSIQLSSYSCFMCLLAIKVLSRVMHNVQGPQGYSAVRTTEVISYLS